MDLFDKYNIKINNKELYEIALTHSSFANEHNTQSYERLEFFGDTIVDLFVSEYIYKETSLEEGGLSKLRASYVCEQALAKYALDMGIVNYIKVGHGQEGKINNTIIADVFESLVAAIYLDSGPNVAKQFIYETIIPHIKNKTQFFGDYKSIFQELIQTTRKSLEYVVVEETGPAHDRNFVIEARVDDIVYGMGKGKSKKEAEQNAALDAINKQAK